MATTINVGIKSAVSAAVSFGLVLLGGFWALTTFILGDARQNIVDVRQDLRDIRTYTETQTEKLASTDSDTSKQLANILVEIKGLRSDFNSMAKAQSKDVRIIISLSQETKAKVVDLGQSVSDLNTRLATMEGRVTAIPTNTDWKINPPLGVYMGVYKPVW